MEAVQSEDKERWWRYKGSLSRLMGLITGAGPRMPGYNGRDGRTDRPQRLRPCSEAQLAATACGAIACGVIVVREDMA